MNNKVTYEEPLVMLTVFNLDTPAEGSGGIELPDHDW